MDVFGNIKNNKLSVANGAAGDYDMSAVVSTEKLVKITADTDIHVLLTPASSTTDATVDDYLISANEEREFSVGRALDRISVFNNSGGASVVYIAILY